MTVMNAGKRSVLHTQLAAHVVIHVLPLAHPPFAGRALPSSQRRDRIDSIHASLITEMAFQDAVLLFEVL